MRILSATTIFALACSVLAANAEPAENQILHESDFEPWKTIYDVPCEKPKRFELGALDLLNGVTTIQVQSAKGMPKALEICIDTDDPGFIASLSPQR